MSSKLVSNQSRPGTTSKLDLFLVPPTQVQVESTKWLEIQPTHAVTHAGPYMFHLPSDPQYIDLAKNFIMFEARIMKDDATELAATDQVAPINCIAKTFFKQVILSMNNTEVSNSSDKYAYRSYLETHLNYSPDVKANQLLICGYSADMPTNDGNNNVDSSTQDGFVSRARIFKRSQWVQIAGSLHIDIVNQDRYIINNLDLRLQLDRNSDKFCLLCHDHPTMEPVLQVRNMKLYMQQVTLTGSVNLAIERTLTSHTAKYPLNRIIIKALHINPGAREASENQLFQGVIPSRIIVGLVETGALQGAYNRNPFNFQHFKVTEASVTAGGNTYPYFPLTTDYPNNFYMRAYLTFYDALGYAHQDRTCGIDPRMFKFGNCFYVFDLSNDTETNGGHFNLLREGTVSVNLKFAEPVPVGGLDAICYSETPGMLEITRERNVTMDQRA